MKIFTPDARGSLISRPNRFIVTVDIDGTPVRAHCPNPGRLIELMNPGRTMILEKGRPGRKTEWTLAAALYNGQAVSMYSARANGVAGELVIPALFPDAREIKAEYTWGKSRFDWHFYTGRPGSPEEKEIFLEVKACTLIEEGIAMFPDAPSIRASRHIEELAELSMEGNKEAHVLFVIMNPGTKAFIPNLHTDPDFALTLKNCSDRVNYHGVSCSCTEEGELSLVNLNVPVITTASEAAEKDSGVYMIMMEMEECRIRVGALGEMEFSRGWYIYAGSAMKNLGSRVKRHLAKRKRKHWHIDYLRDRAVKVKDFPVYTMKNLECVLAQDLSKIADREVRDFGCSDCSCTSHLFYFQENPLQNRRFLDLLFHYRHTLAFES